MSFFTHGVARYLWQTHQVWAGERARLYEFDPESSEESKDSSSTTTPKLSRNPWVERGCGRLTVNDPDGSGSSRIVQDFSLFQFCFRVPCSHLSRTLFPVRRSCDKKLLAKRGLMPQSGPACHLSDLSRPFVLVALRVT